MVCLVFQVYMNISFHYREVSVTRSKGYAISVGKLEQGEGKNRKMDNEGWSEILWQTSSVKTKGTNIPHIKNRRIHGKITKEQTRKYAGKTKILSYPKRTTKNVLPKI